MISKSKTVPVAIFLTIFGPRIYILFITKVKILMLIK